MMDTELGKQKLQEITERFNQEITELFENGERSHDEIRSAVGGIILQLTDMLQKLPAERRLEKEAERMEPEIRAQPEAVAAQEQQRGDVISYYVIEDLSSWADNREARSALERFDNLSDAMDKFCEYRNQDWDYSDGKAKTTLGVGVGSAEFDVLHVRGNENFLVQDFMAIKTAERNPEFLADLQNIHDRIGFDKIRITRDMHPEEVKGFVKARFEHQMKNSGLGDIAVYMERFDSLYEQNRMDNLMPTANQKRITEEFPVSVWENPYLVQRESGDLEMMMEPAGSRTEPERIVTLTVAECGEFHNLGEYYEDLESVDEAIAIFNRIPPVRMNGIPSIGINIHTPGTEQYEDTQMDILSGTGIDLEMLEYMPEIKNNERAMEFIAELVVKMPDKEILGDFPEHAAFQKKAAETLALAIDQFSYEYAPFHYRDTVEDRQAQIAAITKDIETGDNSYLYDFLQGIADDDGLEEDARRATGLMKRLDEYKPLAKVEELEEANYNMIDNVLNNERPKAAQERLEGRVSVREKLAEKKEALVQEVKTPGRDNGHSEPEKPFQRGI